MILALVITAALSRYVLAAVCFFSAYRACTMTWRAGGVYGPHLVLIAVWSVVFGLAMLSLATGLVLPIVGVVFVEALNMAAAMTVGGWALLSFRFRRIEKLLP